MSKPTIRDLRRRGHSYRNFDPAEVHAILDRAKEEGSRAYNEKKREVRDWLQTVEGGRFKPMLEAVSKFYRALDPDERRTFWKRNPGLMAWVRVYNRSEDLIEWEKHAPDGWEDFNRL